VKNQRQDPKAPPASQLRAQPHRRTLYEGPSPANYRNSLRAITRDTLTTIPHISEHTAQSMSAACSETRFATIQRLHIILAPHRSKEVRFPAMYLFHPGNESGRVGAAESAMVERQREVSTRWAAITSPAPGTSEHDRLTQAVWCRTRRHLGVVPLEIGLTRRKQVQIPLARPTVPLRDPGPRRPAEHRPPITTRPRTGAEPVTGPARITRCRAERGSGTTRAGPRCGLGTRSTSTAEPCSCASTNNASASATVRTAGRCRGSRPRP